MRHVPHLHLPGDWEGGSIPLDDAHIDHLRKVLRSEDGDPVTYTDGAGRIGQGVIAGDTIERGDEAGRPGPSGLLMAVAPPTNKDRVRFVVEKLAELGVESLIWLASAHGSRRLPPHSRQRAWAVSALEQSRGAWLMSVSPGIEEWDRLEGPVAACIPGGRTSDQLERPRTIAVGPEGGWAPGEVPDHAVALGLGETILRVETAAIVAAAKFL